jgi:hypothetical protein
LDKPKYVNHLNIDYFTEYPIELLTLMYRADESSDATIYEIPLSKAVQTNSSIHLHFSPVFAKTFYLIIKQESYTLLDGSKSEADISKEEIWKQASTVSKSIYEAAVGDYISQLFATKSAVDLHQTIMDSYQNINKNFTDPSTEPMNEYRKDFNEIKTALDSQQR